MGLNAQQLLQNDPEYLRRQLAQQEIAKYQNLQNPQLGAAGTAGALLGRGLSNMFQGRGFFDVADEGLRKVAETQAIYNRVMQDFDPENPTASWAALSKAYADAGLAGPAQLAQQEYAKAFQTQKELGLRERQVKATEDKTAADIEQGAELNRIRRDTLLSELKKEERLGRYTEAQIKEIQERIARGDKKIVAGKDQYGVTIFYETDERAGTVRPIVPQGSTAAAPGSGIPGNLTPAQIQEEIKKRNEDAARRQSRAGSGGDEAELNPISGQVEFRTSKPTPLSASEIAGLSLQELQEYNRTGRIPNRLMGR